MEHTMPPVSRFRQYWQATRKSIAAIGDKNLGLVSAGVAFFGMLSLFPALAALIAIMGLIADADVVAAQLENYRQLLPDDVFNIMHAQVISLVSTSNNTLGQAGLVSLGVALWSARAGVGAMMTGLNAVYEENNRSGIWHYISALGLTVGLVGVGIVALVAVVIAPIVLAFVPLGPFGSAVAQLLRWSIAIFVLIAGIGMLYQFGPNRKRRVGWFSPGAILAVLSWAALSVMFSYYVANFGNYNQVYGSIGAVIAMLVWLWISSFLVLLGAAFNAALEPDAVVVTA